MNAREQRAWTYTIRGLVGIGNDGRGIWMCFILMSVYLYHEYYYHHKRLASAVNPIGPQCALTIADAHSAQA